MTTLVFASLACLLLGALAGLAAGLRWPRPVHSTEAIAVVGARRRVNVWFGDGPDLDMGLTHDLEPGLYRISHAWHRPDPGSDEDMALRGELLRRIRGARR